MEQSEQWLVPGSPWGHVEDWENVVSQKQTLAGFSNDSSLREIHETIPTLLANKVGGSTNEVPLTERHLRTPREAIGQIETFDSGFFSRRVDNNLNFADSAILRPMYLPHHSRPGLGIETRQVSINIGKLDHQESSSTLYANLFCQYP
jgi:hypothetical protein